MGRVRKLRVVEVRINRPTEYTSWHPRVDRGDEFGALVVGIFRVAWEFVRRPISEEELWAGEQSSPFRTISGGSPSEVFPSAYDELLAMCECRQEGADPDQQMSCARNGRCAMDTDDWRADYRRRKLGRD